MNKTPILAALALAAVPLGAAWAVEPFKTYDNFTAAPINGALWTDAERSVAIKAKALQTIHRFWGSAASDSGLTFDILHEHFQDPAAITEVKATIKVNALEVNACAANSAVAQSRARINGAFFNIATPTPGSEAGDMLAQVRVARLSNSTDAAGVLRVTGLVVQCTNSDCTSSASVGTVDLGTVNTGQAATVQMQWDKPNKQFLFARDSGAFSGFVAYTNDDSHPPGVPFKDLDTRLDIANCTGAKPLTGYVDATFDSVSVNKSAAP